MIVLSTPMPAPSLKQGVGIVLGCLVTDAWRFDGVAFPAARAVGRYVNDRPGALL